MEKQAMLIITKAIQSRIKQLDNYLEKVVRNGTITEVEATDLASRLQRCYEQAVILRHRVHTDAMDIAAAEELAAIINAQLPAPGPEEETIDENVSAAAQEAPSSQSSKSKHAERSVNERNTGNSIYDKISDLQEDKSLGSRLQKGPVNDLVKAIGINQRFTFIQELFGNDPKAFAESVKHLNSLPGFPEAEEFIMKTLVPQFEWNLEDNTVASEFYALVKRRYS